MASQHSTTADFSSRYKFNGKELDRETGWYYYGARYYDPQVSTWLSVDPLAEKYIGFSPYNFTLGNPVKLVDPDGRGLEDEWIVFSTGETKRVGDKGGDKTDYITKVNEDGSITSITQAAGKMKESVSFKSGMNTNSISNSKKTVNSNANTNIKTEIVNSESEVSYTSNYGDKISFKTTVSTDIETMDDKSFSFNPYIETEVDNLGRLTGTVGGGTENSFYSLGVGFQKDGLYIKSSILGISHTNSISLSDGYSTTFGYSKDHITTSYTMSVRPGGGAVIAVLVPIVITQPELAPILLSTP